MPISEEAADLFKKKLDEQGVNLNCPRCGHRDWSLVDKYLTVVLSEMPLSVTPSNRGLPFMVVICSNCGFTSFHNIITLGIIDQIKEIEEKAAAAEVEKKGAAKGGDPDDE